MGTMCQGMFGRKSPGLTALLMIPGTVLVVFGVLIVLEPKILIWLMAGIFIAMGFGMILMVSALRKLGGRE